MARKKIKEKVETSNVTHAELCRIVADHFVKKTCWVALYEYQSLATQEFPDVITFHSSGDTVLYEIKMSRSDFLADAKKPSRVKYKTPEYRLGLETSLERIGEYVGKGKYKLVRESQYQLNRILMTHHKSRYPILEKQYIEAPHLGSKRFYVCPKNLLSPEEIPEGWGLIYFDPENGKLMTKKNSGRFRPNVKDERQLIAHALRRWASGDQTGILVNAYDLRDKK